jgi:hypothetical protein
MPCDSACENSAGDGASAVAKPLLRAGKAALDAESADAGVETLRRAAEHAKHARDPLVLADVLAALGSALVTRYAASTAKEPRC